MVVKLFHKFRSSPQKNGARVRNDGVRNTILFIKSNLLYPVIRYQHRWIWEISLEPWQTPGNWSRGERFFVLGPENFEQSFTPRLRSFLGGDSVRDEIEGVRNGDRLFVVVAKEEFLACSYIFFDTREETRRQVHILGEVPNTPIIGLSYTLPAARGRGLYRDILIEMFRWLKERGYKRVVCEVHPRNTPSNRASATAGMNLCRELRDWTIFSSLVVQQVKGAGRSYWRMIWIRGR